MRSEEANIHFGVFLRSHAHRSDDALPRGRNLEYFGPDENVLHRLGARPTEFLVPDKLCKNPRVVQG